MTGTLADIRVALQKGVKSGDFVGYGDSNALYAQIAAGIEPAWYLIEVFGGHERHAASHLVARRFGICMPEIRFEPKKVMNQWTGEITVNRGKELPRTRLMFTGYIFVFLWMDDSNWRRLGAIPGLRRIVCNTEGHMVTIDEPTMRQIREVEALLCPVKMPPEWRNTRKRHGWRSKRRVFEVGEFETPRTVVRGWVKDGAGEWIDTIAALDAEPPTQSLPQALGFASQ